MKYLTCFSITAYFNMNDFILEVYVLSSGNKGILEMMGNRHPPNLNHWRSSKLMIVKCHGNGKLLAVPDELHLVLLALCPPSKNPASRISDIQWGSM